MAKERLKDRVAALETRSRLQLDRINSQHRRIDKLIVLVTDHEIRLNDSKRDKGDKRDAK